MYNLLYKLIDKLLGYNYYIKKLTAMFTTSYFQTGQATAASGFTLSSGDTYNKMYIFGNLIKINLAATKDSAFSTGDIAVDCLTFRIDKVSSTNQTAPPLTINQIYYGNITNCVTGGLKKLRAYVDSNDDTKVTCKLRMEAVDTSSQTAAQYRFANFIYYNRLLPTE